MTRTRSALLNYLSGLALTAMTMAIGLVSTPLLLRWLGQERFGAVRAATDCAGYLVLLQFGYNVALLPLLAESLNRGDSQLLRRTLAMGLRVYIKLTIITVIGGFALASFVSHIVHVSPGNVHDLKRGFVVGLIGTLAVALTPVRTLADVGQEGWIINFSLMAQSLVITFVSLFLAWRGWGITGQFAAAVAGQAIFQTILLIRARRRVPDLLAIVRHEPDEPEVRSRVSSNTRWSFFLHLSVTASYFADNVVIAFFLGAATVTPFYVTQRIIVICQGQLQGVAGATWAGLIELFHQGKHDILQQRYAELLQVVVVTALCILTPVAACNHAFIKLWVPSTPYAGELITLLACSNAILFGISSLWIQMLDGGGFLRGYALVGCSTGVINFAASVIATWRFGIAGPLIGTLIGFVGVNMWAYPFQIRKSFGIPIRVTLLAILRPLPVALPVAVACWWLVHRFPPQGWITLILSGIFAAAASAAAAWFLEFNAEERAAWKHRFLSGMSRRKSTAPLAVNASPADAAELRSGEIFLEETVQIPEVRDDA